MRILLAYFMHVLIAAASHGFLHSHATCRHYVNAWMSHENFVNMLVPVLIAAASHGLLHACLTTAMPYPEIMRFSGCPDYLDVL